MDIVLSQIDKSYEDSGQKRSVFSGMNALFPSGKRSVIIGKSGVGKSSLLNLISGIDLPDRGEIRIGDHTVSGMDDTRRTIFRRRHIGFVYQFFNLIPVLSVIENVTLISKLDGVPASGYMDRAKDLLRTVGLFDRQHHFPDQLSGGEQQRVAVVRALVNDPEILLADEPTGNLDMETGKQVLDLISNLAGQSGKTLLMVTHSPDATSYADQVLRVDEQRLTVETPGRAVL